ncbi:MAG: YegS/Rv2252/BmrU family lipid kinase [Bacteroidales bacterium]|nr:YegS/Rv2252/BmrU family lipid kinase [Bacteroidales bacterium]
MKIWYIVNPKSGTGKQQKAIDAIKSYADHKNQNEIFVTQYKSHASELAQKALIENVDIIVSVGGDGTLNEISRVIVNNNIALGIIPIGSGNGLAHHLKVPFNLKKAIELINRAKIEKIDTFTINNKRAVSIAGLGYDAFVAYKYDKSVKRGFLPYFSLAVQNFFKFKTEKYILTTKKERLETSAFLITIANSSQWGYNTKIAPKAQVNDGMLNISILKKPNILRAILLAPKLFLGKIDKTKIMTSIECTQLDIERADKEKFYLHIDGEKEEQIDKIEIKCDIASLNIVVP